MNTQKKGMTTNQKRWNELVDIHTKSKSYNLQGFIDGNNSLYPLELKEVGDVRGKKLLHLQCHFGMDTLSWARLGADVTGIDFSDKAIEFAQMLSTKINVPARFICSNIYDLPDVLDEEFDIVYTSYGVLCWLPDIEKWGEVVGKYIKEGGMFFIADYHPFTWVFDDEADELTYKYPYFEKKPLIFKSEYTYANSDTQVENTESYEWQHTMSDIINSLLKAGLVIQNVKEYPYTNFKQFNFIEELKEDRWWYVKDKKYDIPLMYSIKAKK